MPCSPTLHSKGVICRLIRAEDEWDAIRPHWELLYQASPYASTPLHFGWLRRWWRVFAQPYDRDELRIITLWREDRLVGVLPLYERREGVRRLQFISTGEAEYEETCPDYLNLLCLPGEEEVCVDIVWDCIGRLEWDDLELVDVPEESPLFINRTRREHLKVFPRDTCPIADLEGGFDAYLARLSPNGRQQARRLLREGDRSGATLAIADAAEATGAFDDLVRLHQARWNAEGKPGVFAAQRFCSFHRDVIRDWLPTGRAVLATLYVADAPAAVIYGFTNRSTFEFYQSGVDHDRHSALRSPGNLAHLLLMQSLARQGITAYDFLRGSAEYKRRLATRERRLVGMREWRPTFRYATRTSLSLAARVTRYGVKSFFSGHATR
jgi:CelD/BcsL family acetyltransferase involved in cellulose biosynthesis